MFNTSVPAYKCEIFMAGNIMDAIECCQEYCDQVGYCVTVSPTTYVYTDGEEEGIVVGLINYGRVPTNHNLIREKAIDLGYKLMGKLDQKSFTVQDPHISTWYSDRPEDNV